jgi:hypothetical protein
VRVIMKRRPERAMTPDTVRIIITLVLSGGGSGPPEVRPSLPAASSVLSAGGPAGVTVSSSRCKLLLSLVTG